MTRNLRAGLDRGDVRRLGALGALDDFEFHLLTLGQRLVPLHRDRGEVHEDVLATLTLDEAVTLLVREPLDGALSQLLPPYRQATARAPSRRPLLSGRTIALLTGEARGRAGTWPPAPCCGAASPGSSGRPRPGPESGGRPRPRRSGRRRRPGRRRSA